MFDVIRVDGILHTKLESLHLWILRMKIEPEATATIIVIEVYAWVRVITATYISTY